MRTIRFIGCLTTLVSCLFIFDVNAEMQDASTQISQKSHSAKLSIQSDRVKLAKRASNDWLQANRLQVLNDFKRLLSIPNVASDLDAMNRNADWIEAYLQKRSFVIQRLQEGGAPYIFAELRQPSANKTLLIYAHFDGQPINEKNWLTPAWKPQLRDGLVETGGKAISWPTNNQDINDNWRIFARSAGDDKAPIIALMAAIDALKASDLSPRVNIKLILDGEEEAGSPTLDKIISKHGELFKADLMLFCDGPMHQSRQRQLVFGVRGVVGLNLSTFGPSRPLHSGHYGNWVPNAAEQMSQLLASLHDKSGKIAITDFYKSALDLSSNEKRAIKAMPNMDIQLKSELSIYNSRLKGVRLEEAIMQPAIVITGIQVGSTGAKARNVIVPEANASVNFRLVANQTPKEVKELVEKHFELQGFFLTEKPVTSQLLREKDKVLSLDWGDNGYPAFRTNLDSMAALKLKSILTHLDGKPPLMTPTMGGSLPIYLFKKSVGAPIIILPVANHDNNQHGPNENLRLKNLWQAVDVYAAVLTAF